MTKNNFEPVCTEIKMDFDDLTADIWLDPYSKIIEGAYMMPHTKKGILVRLSKMYEYVDKYLQDHEDEDDAYILQIECDIRVHRIAEVCPVESAAQEVFALCLTERKGKKLRERTHENDT